MNALLILAAVGIGYLCFEMARPFLVAIAWAAVLAIIFEPVQKRLERVIKNRSVAGGATVAVALLSVLLPAAAVGALVVREIVGMIPPGSEDVSLRDVLAGRIDAALRWLSEHVGFGFTNVGDVVAKNADAVAQYLWVQSAGVVGGVAGFAFTFIVIMFTLFFFLRDREAVLRSVRGFVPLSDENTTQVFQRVRGVIIASLLGGGAVALSQAILTAIGFSIIGIANPVLWGVVCFVTSFIPFVGAAGVWVPWTIVLLVSGSWGKALALGLWGGLAISMIDNFLRPIIIGDATKLHTLLIFFAILGGLRVFGFLGIIMGPVVLALGLALVEIIRHEIAEEKQRQERLTGELKLEGTGSLGPPEHASGHR
jgi:predicted PurR-regulated permease PerM